MLIGEVTGSLWATRKDEKLNGWKFLVVKLHAFHGHDPQQYIVAADHAGAGVGDMVMITQGSSARASLGDQTVPIDAVIVGIIDTIEVEDA